MYCKNCGQKILESSKYCGQCGEPQVHINTFRNNQKTNSSQLNYDLSYEKDYRPIILGVFVIGLNIQMFSEMKYYHESVIIGNIIYSLIYRVIITIWVVSIAKKLNRDKIGWGVFALFLPSLCLIIIGLKKKIKH